MKVGRTRLITIPDAFIEVIFRECARLSITPQSSGRRNVNFTEQSAATLKGRDDVSVRYAALSSSRPIDWACQAIC